MTYPILDLLKEAVIAIGPERRVYYCNDAFLEMFAIPRARLFSGRPIFESLVFSDKRLFLMPGGEDGLDDLIRYRPVQYKTHQGQTGEVEVAITPTRETFANNPLWFAYFCQDRSKIALLQLCEEIGNLIERGGTLPPQDLAAGLAGLRTRVHRLAEVI